MNNINDSNWVWVPEWDKEDQTRAHLVYFRKKFTADKKREEMKIRVSADSR